METLNNISLTLFLVSLIAFIIGIIKPSILKLDSRKKVSIFTLGALLISLILFGFTQTDEQKAKLEADRKIKEQTALAEKEQTALAEKEQTALAEKEQTALAEKEQTALAEKEQTTGFGITVEEFRENFNANVEKLEESNKKFDVKKLGSISTTKEGDNKLFEIRINKQLEIGGDVNKDGTIKNVALLADISKSNANNFQLYATIILHSVEKNDPTALPTMLKVINNFISSEGDTERLSSDKISFLMTKLDEHPILVITKK